MAGDVVQYVMTARIGLIQIEDGPTDITYGFGLLWCEISIFCRYQLLCYWLPLSLFQSLRARPNFPFSVWRVLRLRASWGHRMGSLFEYVDVNSFNLHTRPIDLSCIDRGERVLTLPR